MNKKKLHIELDKAYDLYSNPEFIALDPISIPKQFSVLQDIEISGFFAAIFSWGRRDTIISKTNELMRLMGNSPYHFIKNYQEIDYKLLSDFKHRTFNHSDLDFYIRALQKHYQFYNSLEDAFCKNTISTITIENNLSSFYSYISQIVPCERRNLKHISTPAKNSACKRLCMYMRWMVRKDKVDFGLWNKITPSQLIIPLDVHVMKIAVKLDLLNSYDKPNWKTALKLTKKLSEMNANDPVKYDFALFGMSAL